jgi:hypothetical protein
MPRQLREEFLIFDICQVYGHVPISFLPQEMYRAKPLNDM